MNIMKKRLLSAAVFSAALFLINGCILNPETEKPPPPEPIEWPDLTEKEDVIETITLCYENYNTATPSDLETHYREILYDEEGHKYVFYLQEGDYGPAEEPLLTLEQDVAGSVNIWKYSSGLTLSLSYSQWEEYTGDEDCDNCWQTTRTYSIDTSIEYGGEVHDLSGTNMTVIFIIRPQHDDPSKWAIYIAYDLPPQAS
ncbi:MAG: hypothetical protein JW746_04010 [Candidatus Krumholzibacteriota bacterium]|nr:hypothetical protein [Candidatus Krumholzibacteriota bacterium]